jgi:hypothetical protein
MTRPYTPQVSHILDTMTATLDADPALRFHWAETAWLQLWLLQGDADTKVALLQKLLAQASAAGVSSIVPSVPAVSGVAVRG